MMPFQNKGGLDRKQSRLDHAGKITKKKDPPDCHHHVCRLSKACIELFLDGNQPTFFRTIPAFTDMPNYDDSLVEFLG